MKTTEGRACLRGQPRVLYTVIAYASSTYVGTYPESIADDTLPIEDAAVPLSVGLSFVLPVIDDGRHGWRSWARSGFAMRI